MSKIEWHLEKRFLNELIPHAKNPRIFTDKGLKDLDKSIDKIGMAQPININTDGTVLSGHARLLTLKNKGVKEVDVYVPSRELTEIEQEEVLIRMNANTAGEWDFDKLANEWNVDELCDFGIEDINNFQKIGETESISQKLKQNSDFFELSLKFDKCDENKILGIIRKIGKTEISNKIVELITNLD